MQLWRLCDVAAFHAHVKAHAEVHARSSLLFKICDEATGSSRLEQKTSMAIALVPDIVKDEAVNYWDEPLNGSVREQPLHRAAYHKKAWLLRLLVRHDAIKPDVNESNELPIDKVLTKLRRAVPAKDVIDCLSIVAERYPDTLGSGPGARPAPIHWVLETKTTFEIYVALVRVTAKHDPRILKQRDQEGRDALLLLMEEDELTAKQPEILDVLLECGADLYTRNTVEGGENALHVAVRRINIQMVTRLLAHDAQNNVAPTDRLMDMKAKITAPKPQKGAKRGSAGRDKADDNERYLTPLELARSLHNPSRDMSITRIITQLKIGKENNKPHRVRGLVYSNRVPPFNRPSPLQVQVTQGAAHVQQQSGTRTTSPQHDPPSATTLQLAAGAASVLPSPTTPQPQDEPTLGLTIPAEPVLNEAKVEIDVLPGQDGKGGTSAEEEESDWDCHEEDSHGSQAGNSSGAGDDELPSKEASKWSDKQRVHGHQELCSFVRERQEEEDVTEALQQKRPRLESQPSSFLPAGVMPDVDEPTAGETIVQSQDSVSQEAMVHTLRFANGAKQLKARFEAAMALRSEALALLRHDTSTAPTMMERIRRLFEALQRFKSAAALAMRSADELSALRVIQAEFTQRVAGAQTAPTTSELEEAEKAIDALKSKLPLTESIKRAWADDDVGIGLSVDLQLKLQRLEEVIRNEGAYKARLRGLCGRLVSVCTAASICKAMDFVSVLDGTMDWDDDSPCRPRSNCGQVRRAPTRVAGFMTMPAFERAKREAVNRHRRLHPLPASAEGRGEQEEEEEATAGQRVVLPQIASPPCSSRWQSSRHRPVSQRSRSLSASANLELNGQHRPVRLKQTGRQQMEVFRHLRSRSSITASELASDDDDESDGQAYLRRSTRSLMIADGEADVGEEDLSEGELDRPFPGLGPAMDVMPVLPNALIEHVAYMGFDAIELEARILPYYVGRLVVAYRDMSIADLVPFYFNVFKDLTSLPTLTSGRYTPRTGRAPCYELHVPRLPNFLWPVFEMVEYEFGASGEGAVLDDVVILLNLPSRSTAPDDGGGGGGGGVPSEAMDDPLMPMLLRLMLSKAGQVRSISIRGPPASEQASNTPEDHRRHQCCPAEREAEHDHNDHGETEPTAAEVRQPPGTSSQSTRRHHSQSVVFVEMETEQAAAEAVRCLEGFPWSVDRILQARKFRDYGREVVGEGAQGDPPPPSSRSNAASSFITDDDDSEALGTSRSGSSGYVSGGRGPVANVVSGLRPPSQSGADVEQDSRPVSAAESDREGVNEDDQDEGNAVEGAGRSWREILAANERALEALRLRLQKTSLGATDDEETEDPAANNTMRWDRAAAEVVDDLLTALRGGPVGAEVGALEEQLNFAIDRMDHETARELEKAILKAYVRDSDIRRAQDEDVVVSVQERNGDAALAREVEQAIGGLFDQRTGSTDSVGAAGNVVQQKVKLVEGCLMAERLRSAELMRRLCRSETRTAALTIEAAQKLTTINLMQNQRTGMLNHIRHLRHANQAVAIRNQELLSRLTSHLQVLGRVEVLQERLMECEERMAHAAAVATVTTSGPTTSTTPRTRPSSQHQQVEHPLEGLERAATLVQSSVGDGDMTATVMTVERLSAVEKGLEDALKAVRRSKEEKIKEEQINLLRHKEAEEAEKLCCICQDSAKSVLLLPCRHLCLCSDCSGRTEVTRCPVCRVEIEEKMTIYA